MTAYAMEFRLRIRNAANSADALTITSTRGGTNPWLSSVPSGDGQEFDPLTGKSRCGAYTGLIADGITSGTDRVVTSQLEDANFRQQLMDRRAFVEYTTNAGGLWSVLIAGFLTTLRLASGAAFEYTVSDPTRAEHDFTAFKPNGTDTIATFIARWPNRGCVFGGPVRGGFLNQPDRGGFEMVFDSVNTHEGFLKFVAGYAPPDFERSTDAEACMTAANAKTDSLFAVSGVAHYTLASFSDAREGQWPGLVTELIGYGYYQPATGISLGASPAASGAHLLKDIRNRGTWIAATGASVNGLPALGTKLRVRCFTAEVSNLSPIYWSGHPVDLLSTLWTEAGLSYNAAAITTVRSAIGADRLLSLRITEPQPLGTFLEQVIYGPFGVGVRTNDAGELVPFAARIPYATVPSTTITSADVWTDESGAMPEIFAIDQSTAVKKIVFEHQRLVRTQEAQDADTPDGFVVQSERFERTNADPSAVGNREVAFSVPGMVHFTATSTALLSSHVDAFALEIFDRWGRGLMTGEAQGLRGGSTDTVALGDEILNALPQLPNKNKRLIDDGTVGSRAMQIVRYTWTPRGPLLKFADSGPNAAAFGTAPTLSIAASTTYPRTVAEVTVTNAAALNALSAGLRLQVAVTTGAAPAATDYVDVAAYVAGSIPTGAIALPAVTAGRKVYARAVATKVGSRPSAWSAVASVTLSALTAPSALAVTPSGTDGSTAQVTWTAGDTTSLVDVYLRASGAPSTDAIRQTTLQEGSTRFLLERLTPGGAYTVGVQDRDTSTGDVSTMVEVTFTAGATTFTLPAPVSANGFTGTRDPDTGVPQRDGVYGIGMLAADYPGFVEVAVAVETSVGAGTYGSFTTSGTLAASVLGNWTIWQDVAPNDGLRRQLKARHIRDGCTSSSYTSVVTVTPWTPVALPPYSTNTAVICEITTLGPSPSTDAGVRVRFQVTGIDPAGGTPTVQILSLGTGVSISSGPAVTVASPNNQVWIVNLPTPGSGPSSLIVRATSGSSYGDATLSLPEQTTLAAAQGTVSIDANGVWSVTADGPANALSFRYGTVVGTASVGYPSDATTASSGTLVTGSRTFSVNSGGTLSFGDTICFTIIPFTGASGTGTQLPSIHLRGAYLTYTATKSAAYMPSNWIDLSGAAVNYHGTTQNLLPNLGPGAIQVFMLPMLVPDGVTLTNTQLDIVSFVDGVHFLCTDLQLSVIRYVSGGATSLGLAHNSSAGFSSVGLSESTSGRNYAARIDINDYRAGSGGVPSMIVGEVIVTYTMGDPKKTL